MKSDTKRKRIKIEDKKTAQALAEFLYMEGFRHGQDIRQIIRDLRALEKRWGVKPTGRFIGKWVDC